MRYLKLFEDISSDGPLFIPDEDDIREAIRDIFVELEEDGDFRICVDFDSFQRADRYYSTYIQIDRPNKPFEIGLVKDKIEMTTDFIKDKWKHIKVSYRLNYVNSDGIWSFGYNLEDIAEKGIEHITISIEKVDYKPTFIDKVNKFFKRK